jgi:hypothetical protein
LNPARGHDNDATKRPPALLLLLLSLPLLLLLQAPGCL